MSMIDKKNIILAFGNKEFNDSLKELKNHFNFNLQVVDNFKDKAGNLIELTSENIDDIKAQLARNEFENLINR